ncbi:MULTISPECIES: SDR family oxidoreductase [unclassified Bacillus (in: firmicutes)]|uniref:SDR family oxidoreductase n=1 Tax=unclassified Bacillus (in: firmicutes) TaxID=185979 RepID=UPI0008DFBFC9|nr:MULTISPECIES: SDR family oxidoreductase [unclassified Bacillus (in: firmicutes)]SFA78104.1 NAD(P)-dependent dehydrogenase, short-chain alcohol dehydrogenase family [Bacillus sp. UNCCL13]SFQ68014.1 NAD(P)-dependent dehydrogenase, short-chain alcohol dehydrogenase family [Bacillus sp. cl95]
MSQYKGIALITGGNRGIGFELGKQLAVKNYQVILGCRNKEKGQNAVNSLNKAGYDMHVVELDVDHIESIQNAVEYVQQTYGRLDVLINNAGVYLDENLKMTEEDPDILEQTLRTNVLGPFHLIQSFLPLMKKNNYGRIVNISSGYGQMDGMDHTGPGSYKLSKLALNGLTRLIAAEVLGNIKINAVCPGWVRTDMGGPHAPRSVEEAAQSILWLTEVDEAGPNGGFFRNGQKINW